MMFIAIKSILRNTSKKLLCCGDESEEANQDEVSGTGTRWACLCCHVSVCVGGGIKE